MQSARDRLDAEQSLALLEGVEELWVAKGRKTLHFTLTDERPDDEEILGLILGRSGTLRAPALKRGGTMVVGYNADILADALL